MSHSRALTEREWLVLVELGRTGDRDKVIAGRLGWSAKQVVNALAGARDKIGADNRFQAILWARDNLLSREHRGALCEFVRQFC